LTYDVEGKGKNKEEGKADQKDSTVPDSLILEGGRIFYFELANLSVVESLTNAVRIDSTSALVQAVAVVASQASIHFRDLSNWSYLCSSHIHRPCGISCGACPCLSQH